MVDSPILVMKPACSQFFIEIALETENMFHTDIRIVVPTSSITVICY